MDQIVKLELTTSEANLLLEALGTMPFVKVYELIGKIQSQATKQFHPETDLSSKAE